MNIIDYQKEVINLIDNSFKKNQISHAYIFEGERGSGLKEVALYFAKKLLCLSDEKPCDKCANCKRVNNGTHANVMLISPVQGVVRKDQINSIIHEGSMTSLTDLNKIYIIDEADKMNRSSSNALLKFLEEPYPNNYLILLTENSNVLLETITSRTQLVRFKRINKTILVKNLQNDGIEKDVAYVLSELFGSFDESKEALKKGTIINVIELFKKLITAKQNNIINTEITSTTLLRYGITLPGNHPMALRCKYLHSLTYFQDRFCPDLRYGRSFPGLSLRTLSRGCEGSDDALHTHKLPALPFYPWKLPCKHHSSDSHGRMPYGNSHRCGLNRCTCGTWPPDPESLPGLLPESLSHPTHTRTYLPVPHSLWFRTVSHGLLYGSDNR